MANEYGFAYVPFRESLERRDPKKLGFSSGFSTLKTHLSGIASKQLAASTLGNIEIPHGLGYRPAFNAYFRDPVNGEVYQCASGFEDVSFQRSGTVCNVHAKSDNYNLTLAVYNSFGATRSIDVFFEVFYEDLTTEPIFLPFF